MQLLEQPGEPGVSSEVGQVCPDLSQPAKMVECLLAFRILTLNKVWQAFGMLARDEPIVFTVLHSLH